MYFTFYSSAVLTKLSADIGRHGGFFVLFLDFFNLLKTCKETNKLKINLRELNLTNFFLFGFLIWSNAFKPHVGLFSLIELQFKIPR